MSSIKTLTDEEVKARLENPDNLSNRLIVHRIVRKNKGGEHLSDSERKLVALLNGQDNSADKVGRALSVSESTVTKANLGRTLSDKAFNELEAGRKKVAAFDKDQKEDIEEKAMRIILASLSKVDETINNVEVNDIKKLTGVAKDVAEIAKAMKGSILDDDNIKDVHVHLYAPERKSLKDYEIIDVE